MNIQKFTQKSMEAIQDCEKLAYEYGNQEIEQEHLLVALLQQEDGLILKLIEKMDIQKEHFLDNAKKHLAAHLKILATQSALHALIPVAHVLLVISVSQREHGILVHHLLKLAVQVASHTLRRRV